MQIGGVGFQAELEVQQNGGRSLFKNSDLGLIFVTSIHEISDEAQK